MSIRIVLSVCLLILAMCSAQAYGDTWTVVNGFQDITFTFADGALSLNRTNTGGPLPGGAVEADLDFSGEWAVCGNVDGGNLVRDNYATFAATETGGGHIVWAANTPAGYSTNLLLGADFAGSGAQTYRGTYYTVMWGPNGPVFQQNQYAPVTRTLALCEVCPGPMGMGGPMNTQYVAQEHSFTATYAVPEPSAAVSILMGIVGFSGLVLRKRR